jgi:hypothetical protein
MRVLLPGYATWILGIVMLQAIDVALTAYGLWHAPVLEGNPLGRMLWGAAGVPGLAALKVAFTLLFLAALLVARECRDLRAVRWGVRVFTASYLGLGIAVAIHNAGVLMGSVVA